MHVYEILGRLFCAIIAGGCIGYERACKNRPAGFRTHILVCIGATIISMIQVQTLYLVKEFIYTEPLLAQVFKADVGRMGSQVITGVGFLGAGAIIRERGSVKGLTTAASVWVVACIGLAIGMGFYFLSLIAVAFVMIALVILKKFENRFIDKEDTVVIENIE